MIVTCWYRVTDDGLKFNHYSQGFDPDAISPPYLHESQRISWQSATWAPRKAELVDGKIENEANA
jgi:hypothetical protein